MTWNSWIVARLTPWRFWFSEASSLLTPSIWKVAPRVPVPLKLMDEPDEAVGLFCPEVGFSWNPAKVSASARNVLLLFRFCTVGRSRICSAVRDCLTSDVTVLMSGRSPTTVTPSFAVGSRRKSTVKVSLRRTSTRSRVTGPKPDIVAVIR